jgi:hypothetical protein
MVTVAAMIALLRRGVRQCSTATWIARGRPLEAEPAIDLEAAQVQRLTSALLLCAEEVI